MMRIFLWFSWPKMGCGILENMENQALLDSGPTSRLGRCHRPLWGGYLPGLFIGPAHRNTNFGLQACKFVFFVLVQTLNLDESLSLCQTFLIWQWMNICFVVFGILWLRLLVSFQLDQDVSWREMEGCSDMSTWGEAVKVLVSRFLLGALDCLLVLLIYKVVELLAMLRSKRGGPFDSG